MRATGIFVYAFLLTLAILLAAGPAGARNAAGNIVIAIVDDGPSVLDKITGDIEAELSLLLPRGVKVEFRDDAPYTIGRDIDEIEAALRGALGDSEVDYVMTTGLIGTYIASRAEFPRSKPIISSYPQPAELFNVPVSPEGRSLVHNLVFVVVPFRLDQDLYAFKEMFPIDTLYVATDSEVVREMENRKDRINKFVEPFGLRVELLPVHRDMSKNEGLFTPSVRYVLLGYMPRLTVPERRRYIELLNERHIPSFSYPGHLDVELGALAALTPDFTRQLVRRVAMNFSELQRGRSLNELPVIISVEGNLLINGKTATEIGYEPSLEIRSYATILNPEYFDTGARELTMKYVFQKAEEQNLSLIIKDTEVEASRRGVQVSRSPMLPQILGRVSGQTLRNDWLTRTFPEETGSAGFTLQQMIYDDRIVSNYRSIKRLYDADLQQRETVRLDILNEAATAFLRYVLARALVKIEQDN